MPSQVTISDRIRRSLEETARVEQECLRVTIEMVADATRLILDSLNRGGKIVLFGNGGSASDAQHLAADFLGRFAFDRSAIPAVALTADTSVLTAIGNDMGFEQVFARQVEALVDERDVVIAISTSGMSANVNVAVECAKRKGAKVIALTGRRGGALSQSADVAIIVPAESTARIQEAHMAIGHAMCAVVEEAWLGAQGGVS